jgi:hypothetical protein
LPPTFSKIFRSISPNANRSSSFVNLSFLLNRTCLPESLECVKAVHVNLITFVDKTFHHLLNLITLFYLHVIYERKSWEPDWLNALCISQGAYPDNKVRRFGSGGTAHCYEGNKVCVCVSSAKDALSKIEEGFKVILVVFKSQQHCRIKFSQH